MTGAAVLFGSVFWLAFEDDAIHPANPAAWVFMPSALRAIQPVAQCAPTRYARSLRDCGDVCGEYSGISFGTSATLDELKATYPLTPLLAESGYHQGQIMIIKDEAEPGCQRAMIELYRDYTQQ